MLLRRLLVVPVGGQADRGLAASIISALASRAVTIDRFFFDWRGGRDPGADRFPDDAFRALAAQLDGRERAVSHPYWSDSGPCSMHIEEVEAIWTAIAEADDWSLLETKVAAIRRMGAAMIHDAPATS